MFDWHNYASKCNFLNVLEMELFQGDLINVPFANKEPSNLTLKIV